MSTEKWKQIFILEEKSRTKKKKSKESSIDEIKLVIPEV